MAAVPSSSSPGMERRLRDVEFFFKGLRHESDFDGGARYDYLLSYAPAGTHPSLSLRVDVRCGDDIDGLRALLAKKLKDRVVFSRGQNTSFGDTVRDSDKRPIMDLQRWHAICRRVLLAATGKAAPIAGNLVSPSTLFLRPGDRLALIPDGEDGYLPLEEAVISMAAGIRSNKKRTFRLDGLYMPADALRSDDPSITAARLFFNDFPVPLPPEVADALFVDNGEYGVENRAESDYMDILRNAGSDQWILLVCAPWSSRNPLQSVYLVRPYGAERKHAAAGSSRKFLTHKGFFMQRLGLPLRESDGDSFHLNLPDSGPLILDSTSFPGDGIRFPSSTHVVDVRRIVKKR